MLDKMTPLEKEWRQFLKKEEKLVRRMEKAGEPFWDKKLKNIVPDKLQETLEAAFYKGFHVIFTEGTGVLEKTFSREKLEADFKLREYAQELRGTRKSLASARRAAGKQTVSSVAGAGAEGAVLGLLGIGLPDIPLFLGVMLRSLYTLALHYGLDYEREEEKVLLLDLLTLSLCRGGALREKDAEMNRRLYQMAKAGADGSGAAGIGSGADKTRSGAEGSGTARTGSARKTQAGQAPGLELPEPSAQAAVRRAARALSGELLYLKFLQGIPVAGVIGGVYDGIYMKKITGYVSIKLERRYLLSKMDGEIRRG